MPADSLDLNTFSAMQLLGRVACGEQQFDREQRQWAIVEGLELSGWSMTEVQLLEGGDLELANRVLRLACRRESEQAMRQLTPFREPEHKRVTVKPAAAYVPESNVPNVDLLRRVARGSATLISAQRESLVVEAMILSGGTLSSVDLLTWLDSALATFVLGSELDSD